MSESAGGASSDVATPRAAQPADLAATADLLSAFGASPFAISNGPDVVVTRDAGYVGGATVWVQNPFSCDLEVLIGVGRESHGVEESVDLRLGPLEVGRLSIPVLVGPHSALELTIFSPPLPPSTQRTREPVGKRRLDTRGTVAGLLEGAAGLVLFGVGRFSVGHKGGSTASPLTLRFETSNPPSAGARIQYERIWAPLGTRPTVPIVPHREAWSWELTVLGKALLAAVFIGVFCAVQLFVPHSDQTTAGITLIVAAALTGLCAAILKFRKIPRLARPPRSLLPG